MDDLQPLLDKLKSAKFTGTLELRIDNGEIAWAKLQHCISRSEFSKPLPVIDSEADFALQP